MKKILSVFIIVLIPCILLTGCWSYEGLNEMTIVTGVAVDYDEVEKQYNLTFEIIDTINSSKQTGVSTAVVESKGTTVFTAIRKVKRKLPSKLYFGNAKVLIICGHVAKEKGIKELMDFFARDHEPRETFLVFVTKDFEAKDVFQAKEITGKVISHVITEIVQEDTHRSNALIGMKEYEVHNQLQRNKQSLLLPVIQLKEENKKKITIVEGLAIFKKDKLIGYITGDEAKYVMFTIDRVIKGTLAFDINQNGKDDVSFEIMDSSTKRNVEYKNGKATYFLDILLEGTIVEKQEDIVVATPKDILKIESAINESINKKVTNAVEISQQKYNSDYIGVAKSIYFKDYKLWKTLEPQWDTLYPQCDVQVNCRSRILSTGLVE
ncbi:Ger(x)C family spore germination protein [Paludicola sp. MB14-C6]|uniref:Ger(x)C family spore germination protein n=1 Tax=Paludihabitans sp. MB14-C6 TaxID=3070656 RepID=UPI0027DD7191|nr:Ger(x)C family spore germination protein [Paludicola sp. MB14-C6]WMJ24042.1 Ger(x)C family spore germination protein [Paludicola sp. MB14-C6]